VGETERESEAVGWRTKKGPFLFQSRKRKGRILANQNAPMGMLRIMAGNRGIKRKLVGGKKKMLPTNKQTERCKGARKEGGDTTKTTDRDRDDDDDGWECREGAHIYAWGDMDPGCVAHY